MNAEPIKYLEFPTSLNLWEGINEYMFTEEKDIYKRGGFYQGTQVVSYDMMLKARKAFVDDYFNFGNILGYSMQKWTTLVNNYINLEFLDLLKAQILVREKKKQSNYNEALLFDNSHNSGKGCLLSLVVSRRACDIMPTLTFSLRSSEITKRLIFDLLLVQRVGEYIFGKGSDFSIQVYSPQFYMDVAAFCMYDNHKPLKPLMINGKPKGKIQEVVMKYFDKFLVTDRETVNYKSHQRVVEMLQRDENGKPIFREKDLLAKDLTFDFLDNELPQEFLTPKEIRAEKRKKKNNK